MGFNTACLILNDQLHRMKEDPKIGESIQLSVLTAGRKTARDGDALEHRTVAFDCLPAVHADVVQVVRIGGNRIDLMGTGNWRDDDLALLRKIADQMGYRLSKKPEGWRGG